MDKFGGICLADDGADHPRSSAPCHLSLPPFNRHFRTSIRTTPFFNISFSYRFTDGFTQDENEIILAIQNPQQRASICLVH